MTTIRRKSRQRVERDPIPTAWDAGDPPPPEAFQPEHHDDVIDCIFFRWAEAQPAWDGDTHPHRREWSDALAASRPTAAAPVRLAPREP